MANRSRSSGGYVVMVCSLAVCDEDTPTYLSFYCLLPTTLASEPGI